MSHFASYFKERENVETLESEHGFAIYSIRGEECYIRDIYVTPEARKTGAASRMANQITEIAKEKGCKYATGTVCPTANNSTDSLKVLLSYGMKLHRAEPNLIIFIKEL